MTQNLLTRLTVRNFKGFVDVDLELGGRVLLIGPNNSGKTSALQALALWQDGVRRWVEKRGSGAAPKERPGVVLNRRDLIHLPVPAVRLLWHDRRIQEGRERVVIEIRVAGVTDGLPWVCGLEFYYGNEESFYCRPVRDSEGNRMGVPAAAERQTVALLGPMSGLAAQEDRLTEGAIKVRLGEGRTAEVLRNLCYQVYEDEFGSDRWQNIAIRLQELFGVHLNPPRFIAERGELTLTYRDRNGIELDISCAGRGQQQTLLLLAHMAANPGTTLLLDEPDAHLEILRQRQIYQVLTDIAGDTGCQILAASHSEVMLNEAAGRDTVLAFVGRPHRIDDRGSQVLKSLRDIGFEHYYQAEETGWVLYLEGATDLAILRAFARKLGHPAVSCLERPFVHYVANQPRKAQAHFHGLREAKPDLVALAIYDRLDQDLPDEAHFRQVMWHRRELENYLTQRETLLAFAAAQGGETSGPLFSNLWADAMARAIDDIEAALATLGEPSPWGPDIKASDAFLDRLFPKFYRALGLENLLNKTNYHVLAPYVGTDSLDPEIAAKLDLISETACRARPRGGEAT